MNDNYYYHCPIDQLHEETHRRGYIPWGGRDQLSETLNKDDAARGTDASTLKTEENGPYVPREVHMGRTAEFGRTVQAGMLVNEKIIHWTMNTFFPTLQLFFASGRSCTIAASQTSSSSPSPNLTIGLDPKLRFRLTDCTHEEDGRFVKTTLSDKFARPGSGILLREASIATRTSVAVKYLDTDNGSSNGNCGNSGGSRTLTMTATHMAKPPIAIITRETHTVVGLRLEGMSKMSYIWASANTPPCSGQDKYWVDVRIAGLRNDVPAPLLCFPSHTVKPGGEAVVVVKESMISKNTLEDDIEDFWKY